MGCYIPLASFSVKVKVSSLVLQVFVGLPSTYNLPRLSLLEVRLPVRVEFASPEGLASLGIGFVGHLAWASVVPVVVVVSLD